MLRKRDLAVSRIVIIGMSIAWKMAKLSFTDVDGKGFSMVGKTNGSIPNGERPPGPLTILICRIGCTSIYRNEKKGASVIGRSPSFSRISTIHRHLWEGRRPYRPLSKSYGLPVPSSRSRYRPATVSSRVSISSLQYTSIKAYVIRAAGSPPPWPGRPPVSSA